MAGTKTGADCEQGYSTQINVSGQNQFPLRCTDIETVQ